MGLIKFELELPEFDNEISINLTIKKDGEVMVYNPSTVDKNNLILYSDEIKTDIKKPVKEKEKKETTKKSNISGNFMNDNFD